MNPIKASSRDRVANDDDDDDESPESSSSAATSTTTTATLAVAAPTGHGLGQSMQVTLPSTMEEAGKDAMLQFVCKRQICSHPTHIPPLHTHTHSLTLSHSLTHSHTHSHLPFTEAAVARCWEIIELQREKTRQIPIAPTVDRKTWQVCGCIFFFDARG